MNYFRFYATRETTFQNKSHYHLLALLMLPSRAVKKSYVSLNSTRTEDGLMSSLWLHVSLRHSRSPPGYKLLFLSPDWSQIGQTAVNPPTLLHRAVGHSCILLLLLEHFFFRLDRLGCLGVLKVKKCLYIFINMSSWRWRGALLLWSFPPDA